ncbi:MAG: heavy metal translocating P-type ATPase [Candidatus Parabeggiatoa sp. nov. 1]|nr:MAG: heavy metal translocating P-type ATPase [Gammaproteobacteria bacterium]
MLIPLIPVIAKIFLAGSAVYGAMAVVKKTKVRKKVIYSLKKVDNRYQQIVQKHFDPFFGTDLRHQQIENFSGEYTDKEVVINRRLGLAIANTGLAILGEMYYPSLLVANGLLLLYIILPMIYRNLKILIQEKRIKFRFFASLSVLVNYISGFYVIGSLILVVVFFAFKLAARTEEYSRKSLIDTFALQPPDSVWVLVDGVEVAVPFSQLQIGDFIILNAGQTVPVDGCIVQGIASIDQHMLTGESQPVEKTVGDKVLASTLLLAGKLQVRVEKTGTATGAAQIGKILNNAANYHSFCEARSERMADQTTLPTLSASALAWLTVGSGGALAILNSDFGSSMIFSGPLNMLSYLNIASHGGILVKDGRSLEILHTIDTVVFDKTGTLTLEQPEVGHIHSCNGWTEQQVLYYAATAEYRQSHPIARAILSAAKQQSLEYLPPDEVDYEIGFGIRVICQGKAVRVGSARFMAQELISLPAEIIEQQQRCQEKGYSLVMVAVDKQLIGTVELQTQLRHETAKLVQQLHKRGLKIYILSGDHQQPTQHIAERLGIDDFFAEVLPEGKANIINKLQQEGRKVCFVGDGINDAIALRQADVSISLRGATTVATDSAQIVLVSQSLQQLNQLFDIVEGFNTNQNRSLLFAFVPGGMLIAGVFLFHLEMPAALVTYSVGLAASLGNALYPLLKFNQQNEATKKNNAT